MLKMSIFVSVNPYYVAPYIPHIIPGIDKVLSYFWLRGQHLA
jgi:hypothetical protein